MSNQLHFPVRIYEDETGNDFILMVPHEDKQWSNRVTHIENTNLTRQFCNWIRKQFPDVPTEFRFVNQRWASRRRTSYSIPVAVRVNCDKHFVVYGLTKNQMLMIKLAWMFETQQIAVAGESRYSTNVYVIDKLPVPSDALRKRMENKTKPKAIDTL